MSGDMSGEVPVAGNPGGGATSPQHATQPAVPVAAAAGEAGPAVAAGAEHAGAVPAGAEHLGAVPAGAVPAGPQPFAYAVLRVIPRVDRGEAMNAGILLYCRPLGYLNALIELDAGRLRALDPAADVGAIERALAAIARVCAQAPGAGQAGLQDIGRRFGWLTAPRSTVVQAGPVHTGLTADPAAEAERLLRSLVRLSS